MNNIILVGFSGTGKTQVGREVARLLGWEFLDTDAQIEERAGKPIHQIFEGDGESAFRLLEKQAIQDACSGQGRVISTGGGVVVDPENRDLMLRRGLVICLEALPETIYRRLMDNDENPVAVRPLLSGHEPLERIRTLKDHRQSFYSEAHVEVHTDNLTVEHVAQEVMSEFLIYIKNRASHHC